MIRTVSISACLLIFVVTLTAQRSSTLIRKQMRCDSDPKPGAVLSILKKESYIGKPYNVVDSVNYFRLRKPLKLWGFTLLAVYGWQNNYGKFFVRGPGTLPPEVIGVVVSEPVDAVKGKLMALGHEKLDTDVSGFDLRGEISKSNTKLTEISCTKKWIRFPD